MGPVDNKSIRYNVYEHVMIRMVWRREHLIVLVCNHGDWIDEHYMFKSYLPNRYNKHIPHTHDRIEVGGGAVARLDASPHRYTDFNDFISE